MSAPANTVKDGDTASFAADVIEASNEVPVIVDFWAEWCGPCKTLGPTIEKAVKAASGQVRLVKINVDENQQLAQQLRVQSIPAVFAFKNGKPVDGFVGAQPESQIKAFIQRLTGDAGPSPIEQALEQGEAALAAGDVSGASDIFGQVLRADMENARAIAGLCQCLIDSGDLAEAREMLDGLEGKLAIDPAVQSVRAALELAEQSADAGDTAPLRARLEANGNDHEARMELSTALLAAGQREEAVDELLESIRRDRNWNDEAARKQLLTLFEAFGHADELTVSARRRLSSMLFS
jgi:putative thioredoxin|tara:strand:- start:23075 stop:23956 length:882 start_codon:yes stop_codon:yes gene_type:complete